MTFRSTDEPKRCSSSASNGTISTDYSNFWTYYYTLRKYALYDFITGKDIDVSVKEMVE